MAKRMLYIIITLILLLSACTKERDADSEDLESEKTDGSEVVDSVPDELTEVDERHEEEVEAEGVEEIEPLYELNAVWALTPIDDANPKAVLLTIDDAPDKYALDMAKVLKELDAPAIFFVNGHFIESDEKKQILKEIYDLGFAIGNHTKTHANLKSSSEEEQKEEILYVSDLIEEVIGERPKFFRAPFGVNTDFSRELVEAEGMLLMNWSYGYDWEKQYMDAAALTDIMINTEFLGNGSNLLMHDREWTAAALKDIVEGLRDKGYDMIDPAAIKGVAQ